MHSHTHTQSNVSTALPFGMYTLEMDGQQVSFDLDDQNITQIVFAQRTDGNIELITVSQLCGYASMYRLGFI